MNRCEIRGAIRQYLTLIEEGAGSDEEVEKQLVERLDHLAYAMHFVGDPFEEDEYPHPQWPDQDRLRDLICQRFSRLGWYNVPECVTDKLMQCGLMVGDAIDDVLDIANELYNVEWCWVNTSEEDAMWHLKFTWESHWNEHLRNLQLFMHYLLDGEESR